MIGKEKYNRLRFYLSNNIPPERIQEIAVMVPDALKELRTTIVEASGEQVFIDILEGLVNAGLLTPKEALVITYDSAVVAGQEFYDGVEHD